MNKQKHARVASGGAVHLVDERGYPVCGSGQSSHAHNFRSRRARIHTSDPVTCKKCLTRVQEKGGVKVDTEKILVMQAYRRSDPTRLVSWYARPNSAWLYPEETRTDARSDSPISTDLHENQWSPDAFYDPTFTNDPVAQRIKLYLGRQISSLDWKRVEESTKPLLLWQLCADTVLLAFGQDYWGKRTDIDMIRIEIMFASLKALRAHLLEKGAVTDGMPFDVRDEMTVDEKIQAIEDARHRYSE